MASENQGGSRYRIGAVVRLTGVSADTLRAWERRYEVVTPQRSEGGSRLYSEDDVARLALIKRLVDSGHAIGTVAGLSLEQLEARSAGDSAGIGPSRPNRSRTIAIVGSTLPLKLAASMTRQDEESIVIAGTFEDLTAYEAVASHTGVDALVIEVPVVIEETVAQLRRIQRFGQVRRLVVVYGYGKRRSIGQMERLGMDVLQYPTDWSELHRLFESESSRALTDLEAFHRAVAAGAPAPARRFDDRHLATLSSRETSVDCECPRHLADLVVALARFEIYSADCEDRSEKDALLHSYVVGATAHARALLEAALSKVLEVDGISLDPLDTQDDGAASLADRH